MRLLALSSYAKEALVSQRITQGHAKILVNLDESKQQITVDTIIGQKLSVREAEYLVKNGKNSITNASKTSLNSFKIGTSTKGTISKNLPFKHKIKQHSVEIMLPNEEEVIKFISFLESK
jgi:ParB family chromosome partitioning protein